MEGKPQIVRTINEDGEKPCLPRVTDFEDAAQNGATPFMFQKFQDLYQSKKAVSFLCHQVKGSESTNSKAQQSKAIHSKAM